jgi:hypothetical protein
MFPFGFYSGLRDLNHDRELAATLGDMVIAWSNAENALVNVFYKITNVSWAMAAAGYYRIPSFEARTKTIRAMLCEWNTEVYDPGAIYRAVLKLNSLSKFRNDLVHGSWAQAYGSGETVIFDYRERPDAAKRYRPVKSADIKNHVEAVHRRTDQLSALMPFSGPPEVHP